MNIDFPFRFANDGTTGTCGYVDHIYDLVEQVLFTNPGERVYRPEFGCGLLQLVFEPNSEVLGGAIEASTRAALEEWLGELIEVDELKVNADEERLVVDLAYEVIQTGELRTEQFEKGRYIA